MLSMDLKYIPIFTVTLLLLSGTLLNYLTATSDIPFNIPPKSAKLTDVDCERVLAGDQQYVSERVKHRRTVLDPGPGELDISCEGIHSRHPILATHPQPIVSKDCFGIAYARAVYRDYVFLEAELATNYAPQNWYCYAIDKKTDETFRGRMKALANCVPNVMVTKQEYEMDRYGHNMWKSLLECMKMLLEYKWKNIIMLQNWDIQLKTNEELVQIFKWLNGTNDIQYTHVGAHWIDFRKHNWTLAHLHLFRNESKNRMINPLDGSLLTLEKIKGQVHSSLSRPFVKWLINDLNTTQMLDQLNSYKFPVEDEVFIPTLAANEFLQAPGGFTRHCYNKTLAPSLTRFAYWIYPDSSINNQCRSRKFRNEVCIFGLEDLVPNFLNSPFMFANKVQPAEFDADVVGCWHEVIRNRTFVDPGLHRLRAELYTELPQVRYNEIAKRDGHVNLDQFNCTYKFLKEVKYGQQWSY